MSMAGRSRVILYAWIALSAGTAVYAVLSSPSESALGTTPVAALPNLLPERVWFEGPSLTGWRLSGGALRVIRTPVPPRPGADAVAATVSLPGVEPAAVAVDRSGNSVFWLEGTRLMATTIFAASPRRESEVGALPGSLLAVGGDGSVLLLDKLGSFRSFDPARLTQTSATSLPVKDAGVLRVFGPYVAAANLTAGEVAVAAVREGRVSLLERRSFGTPLSALTVTPGGRLIAATAAGTLLGAPEPSAAPGVVRDVEPFDDGSLLLAGDFDGIHRLEPGRPTVKLAGGGDTLDVAWSAGHMGVASPRGLELHSYQYRQVLTSRARSLILFWLMGTGLAAGLVFSSVLYRFAGEILLGRRGERQATGDPEIDLRILLQTTADLSETIARRECVVVVGEHLSRLSGMPLWETFHADIADNAAPGDLLTRLAGETYRKAAPLSAIHTALGRVPLAAAVSFTLDSVLERALLIEDSETFGPGELAGARAALRQGTPFLLKIRGVLSRPAGVIVPPDAALAAFAADPDARQLTAALLNTRTLLFLGIAAKEIEAFAAAAQLPGPPARKHYAILPAAAPLRKSFGVEALPVLLSQQDVVAQFLETIAGPRATAAGSG